MVDVDGVVWNVEVMKLLYDVFVEVVVLVVKMWIFEVGKKVNVLVNV